MAQHITQALYNMSALPEKSHFRVMQFVKNRNKETLTHAFNLAMSVLKNNKTANN